MGILSLERREQGVLLSPFSTFSGPVLGPNNKMAGRKLALVVHSFSITLETPGRLEICSLQQVRFFGRRVRILWEGSPYTLGQVHRNLWSRTKRVVGTWKGIWLAENSKSQPL